MVYLLKLDNFYKIGYSGNIEKRIKTLGVTHVDIQLLNTIDNGTYKDESFLHGKCGRFRIKNELFEACAEVELLFLEYKFMRYQENTLRELKELRQRRDEEEARVDKLEELFLQVKMSYLH